MREEQYVSFRIADRLLGVNILTIREIIRNVDFTPVEKAPLAVRGLLNLRGQIITVLDLAPALGLPLRDITADSRCIIVKTDEELSGLIESGRLTDSTSSEAVGLIVDSISDVVPVGEDDLESAPANANGLENNCLRGVVKLEGALLLVLRLNTLIDESVRGRTADVVGN